MAMKPEDLPDIITEWGIVTKSAQWQASENLRHDHALRDKVVRAIGEEETRRRYPTAFLSDEEVARMSKEPTE